MTMRAPTYRKLRPGEIAPKGYQMRYTENTDIRDPDADSDGWFAGGSPGTVLETLHFHCCEYRCAADVPMTGTQQPLPWQELAKGRQAP